MKIVSAGSAFCAEKKNRRAHENGQQAADKMLSIINLTPVRMAIVKKTKRQQVAGKDVEEREYIYTAGGNANWSSHCGKQCEVSSKTQKYICYTIQQSHFPLNSKGMKTGFPSAIGTPCLLQHYSQQLRYGNRPNAHPWLNR